MGEPILRSGGGPLCGELLDNAAIVHRRPEGMMAPTMPAKFLPKFPQSQGGARNPPMGSESGLSWSSFHLYCFLTPAENLFTFRDLVVLSVMQIFPET